MEWYKTNRIYICFFQRIVIEIQTLHIKQSSNLCNLHTHTHTHTHNFSVGGERGRVILYSKHKRSASDNGCVSCLSSWSEHYI